MTHDPPSRPVPLAPGPRAPDPDAALVARARLGDPDAQRALYDRHVGPVYRFIFRLTGRRESTEEWTQDTFVRAFARLDQFRGDAAFATWLRTIALNLTRNGLATLLRREARAAPLDDALDVATAPVSDPDLADRLEAAIAALPTGTRAVYVMHDLEGYTHDEIATHLGIAEGTSKSQLSRARARLRTALAAFRNMECA
ncbi:MAG: RNA polymerase sigma factor [Gemmatimonadetes bacterium]|nr:RNA polymerase sigma factor [Gemmatimonadota bacterium]